MGACAAGTQDTSARTSMIAHRASLFGIEKSPLKKMTKRRTKASAKTKKRLTTIATTMKVKAIGCENSPFGRRVV